MATNVEKIHAAIEMAAEYLQRDMKSPDAIFFQRAAVLSQAYTALHEIAHPQGIGTFKIPCCKPLEMTVTTNPRRVHIPLGTVPSINARGVACVPVLDTVYTNQVSGEFNAYR